MAVCPIGSSEYVTVTELKKLCAAMHAEIDTKIAALEAELEEQIAKLDTERISALETKVLALQSAVNNFEAEQAVQDARITDLESNAANTAITTSEVVDIWESTNG